MRIYPVSIVPLFVWYWRLGTGLDTWQLSIPGSLCHVRVSNMRSVGMCGWLICSGCLSDSHVSWTQFNFGLLIPLSKSTLLLDTMMSKDLRHLHPLLLDILMTPLPYQSMNKMSERLYLDDIDIAWSLFPAIFVTSPSLYTPQHIFTDNQLPIQSMLDIPDHLPYVQYTPFFLHLIFAYMAAWMSFNHSPISDSNKEWLYMFPCALELFTCTSYILQWWMVDHFTSI